MKAQNLLKLRQSRELCGLTPDFIVIDSISDLKKYELCKDKRYAVRSSCEAEDGSENSHAGQFKTLLNVKQSDLTEAVQCVIDSFGEYKGRVIIQKMIQSELSGVIFTANPIGILNEIVIVAGRGTGDGIVEDRVETTTYYYNTDDRIYCCDGESLINNAKIKELVRIAAEIRDFFQFEADIEFAMESDRIYILQVRPITTLKGRGEIIVLDNSNIVESYPGVSLPLTQDFVKEIYYRVFQSLILRITKDTRLVNDMDRHLRNMVAVANARIYYRMDNWYNVLGLLPFSERIVRIWQQMLGIRNRDTTHSFRAGWKTKLCVAWSFLNLLITSPRKMKELNEYFFDRLEGYRDRIDGSATTAELLETYEVILRDLTSVWDITLVNDMYTFLFSAMSGKKGKEQLADIKNLESMRPVILLNELVKIYSVHGDDDYFRKKEAEYIAGYGDRCPGELKLETRTYRTNPEQLREYVKKARVQNLKTEESKVRKVRENFLVKRAKIGIYHRELSRMNRTRIFGMAREIMLKAGENLVAAGRLEKREDVFYLFYQELYEAHEDKDYRRLVEQRKWEYENEERLPGYSRLVFQDEIIHKRLQSGSVHLAEQPDILYGTAACTGVVTGEVLVLDSPKPGIDISNRIIVAQTTDPGWVFLIKNSLGIITQRGSILSHTAIITRELKKPSVVNVKDITKAVKTGDIVELNGRDGTVRIVRRR